MRQQSVNPGYSNVVDMLYFVPHHLRSDDRLLGHWDIAGSRRNYGDHTLAIALAIALQNDGPGHRTILGFLYVCGHGPILLIGRACCQYIATVFGQSLEDGSDVT